MKHRKLVLGGLLVTAALIGIGLIASQVALFSGETWLSRGMYDHIRTLHPGDSDEELEKMVEDRVRMLKLARKEGIYDDVDVQYAIDELVILKLRQKFDKPTDDFANAPDDKVLQEYYTKHTEKYREPEQRRIALVRREKNDNAEQNAAFAKVLAEFRESLTGGFNPGYGFGQLASRYSSHKRSRLNGGDMGWLLQDDERDLPAEVDKAIWSIQEKGQISEVELEDATWYVLLSDLRDSSVPEYGLVAKRVLYDYFQEQQKETEGQWRERWAAFSVFRMPGVGGVN